MGCCIALVPLCCAVVAPGLALSAVATASSSASAPPHPLPLDVFDDDDCLEAENADVLISLLDQMCGVLEDVLHAEEREPAWEQFDAWGRQHVSLMLSLAGTVLARPYCEPAKVAWMATECLLLLRQGEQGVQQALECAAALDEDLLARMTPRGESFTTRLHLVMRSPWPAFRLLDLLVRLHPESKSTRMGVCARFMNWQQEPDVFDWPWFKENLARGVDALVQDHQWMLELKPEDGPLSRQYRQRWLRVHKGLRVLVAFSDDVAEAYKDHHYRAGCHVGVIACYVLQVLVAHQHDVEGRVHRLSASVAHLINLHAPFSHLVKTDWPLFRLLHLASLLQRMPPAEVWQGGDHEKSAPSAAARHLCESVEAAVLSHQEASGEEVGMVYLTAAWGHLARFVGRVMQRWASLQSNGLLLLLALDAEALRFCKEAQVSGVHCLEAPRRLGVEGAIAKYLAMAAITRRGVAAVWLDLDVYVVRDPGPSLHSALAAPRQPEMLFARHAASESMNPAVVVARGSHVATDLLLRYAGWLKENPYLLDDRGWDQLLQNRAGDYAGGFDYKGRNITLKDDKGPAYSFLPKDGLAPIGLPYDSLGEEFGSGDGWAGHDSAKDLVFFHFWGADETQEQLFDLLYPHKETGLPERAQEVIGRYHRTLSAGPQLPSILSGGRAGVSARPLHLTCISYASGCCEKSLQKNRRQALAVGCDQARAYGREDLGPAWAARNSAVLSQKPGGGWWLWKPYVILRTLRDPAVPWYSGVVVWVDAGNFLHADPRPLLSRALQGNDVAAMRLKWCLEHDWTSPSTLARLAVQSRYAVVERNQLGAYFLAFRKTEVAISFVETWLQLAEDEAALTGVAEDGSTAEEPPNYQKHQADQSIFSVLFKERGFRATTLEEGHRVVTLARWRE